MDEEQLVEAVRAYPCLWKSTDRSYKDLRARENAWKEVVQVVGGDIKSVTAKWKALRDRFVKELRKTNTRRSGDAGPPYVPSWSLFEIISFLKESVKHRQSDTNFDPPPSPGPSTPRSTTPPTPADGSFEANTLDGTVADMESEAAVGFPGESSTEPCNQACPKKKKRKIEDIEDVMLRNLKNLEKKSAQKEDED